MQLRRIFLAFSVLALVGSCSQPQNKPEEGLTLQIIHINDTHSQFDASPASVRSAAGEPLYTFIGGHPRLLTQANLLREQAKAQGISSLFLHGGDAFKGSVYFELFEQKINIDILNLMQLDAMALGNHEFDIGLEKLADFANGINFPLLAANVDTSAEATLANVKNLKPYQVFILKNKQWQATTEIKQHSKEPQLAVFGLALEDMRAMVPETGELLFNAEVATAQQTVDHLKQQGITHIVALTHLGNRRDLTLAQQVNGIDVIVGGHSHTLLGDFRQWYLGLQGPYAQRVMNPDGQSFTCVVQAGQFAQAIGAVTVRFNPQGQIDACDGQNTLLASEQYFTSAVRQSETELSGDLLQQTLAYVKTLDNTAITAEDKMLRQVLNDVYYPAVKAAYGEPVSITERTIAHVRLPGSGGSDQHGSELAAHITDAMYQWLNSAPVQQVLPAPVDFALIGAGNIRSPLEAGTIYEGHIRLEVLPFDTPLSVLTVSGEDVLALLHDTIAATLPAGAHAGKFPYSSHLRYTATATAGGGVELSDVAILRNGQWLPVQAGQYYRLATTNYLTNGNDGWQRLQQVQQQSTDRQDLILVDGKVTGFNVQRVNAQTDASGQQAFTVEYAKVADLPCKEATVDCKVAAQAFIDYLRAEPDLWQKQRAPTVTLIR